MIRNQVSIPQVVIAMVSAAMLLASCGGGGSEMTYEDEVARSEAFLAKASAVPGAQTTATGLVYREITPGTGPMPVASDMVRVHYRGTLVDGTEFDSSIGREPLEVPLGRLIPCWVEGLQMMRVGGKNELVCPSAIGYGDAGAPPDIPGGAALVFEVELLAIVN